VGFKDFLTMYKINFILNSMPSQMQSTKKLLPAERQIGMELEYAMAFQHSGWQY